MSGKEPCDFSGAKADGRLVVGIFGCGSVGGTTAFSLLHSDAVGTVLVTDVNKPLEDSMIEDLSDAAYPDGKRVGRLDDDEIARCDYVVVAAGSPQRSGQGRMELLETNEPTVREIARRLQVNKFSGTAIMVTNPVDTLTGIVCGMERGYDVESTGTRLDEIRLRRLNGSGTVVGTHDDSPVALVDGVRSDVLTKMVRSCAERIIRGQGRTMYGIATVVRLMVENGAKKGIGCTE